MTFNDYHPVVDQNTAEQWKTNCANRLANHENQKLINHISLYLLKKPITGDLNDEWMPKVHNFIWVTENLLL